MFLKTNGVTPCPGSFTPEMRQHHIDEQMRYNAMTPEQRKEYIKKQHGWGRGRPKSGMTPEQKKERRQQAAREWYQRNKEQRREYTKEYKRKKREARKPPQVGG